ncbi:MAG: heavy metal translocating P-type ATPase [Aphanocapsa sp. GSE-SYN-MK-11-07L]|jgi:heavy metal translocating P-type ATPase|nr:heavy metal translocating P-type ATPase [Aphanocapsa sp. GSE-SYN-MK-11-07L]
MPPKSSPPQTSERPESTTEQQLESLGCQLVHQTSQRWRILIPQLLQDIEYVNRLHWLIGELDFVISFRINPLARSIVIDYKEGATSRPDLQESVWVVILRARTVPAPSESLPFTETRPEINWLERMGLPVLSLGLALLAQQLLPIPALLVGGLVVAAAVPFVTRMIQLTIDERRLDADVLDVLWLTMYTLKGDFVAPALMINLMESGEALRDLTARTNERQALDLFNRVEQFARIERDGQEFQVPLLEVQIGDRVVVYPGETIPVSGRILRGTALVDEHKLTGESTLVSRSEGQVAQASTLVLEGKLCILTKRVGKNTRMGITLELMRSAPVHDTRIEDYSAQIANAAIAPSIALGGAIFAFTGDISRALAPLHLDFSHGIRLAVPTTILSALTYAARQGVYIRSGRALEMLSRVDTLIFDKTGTMTQGNAEVVAVLAAQPQILPTSVLALAASLERESTYRESIHPVASAILRYAAANDVQLQTCEVWDYRIGMGIIAQINGERVLAGSSRLMQQEGIDLAALDQQYPDLRTRIESLVYVAQAGELLGVILYTDPLRPEVPAVIQTLQAKHIGTYMLTGDNPRVARNVSRQLGIDPSHVYADVLPQGKVEVIYQLREQGKTIAFIGEGINDAAGLAHADVSFSIASGNDMARETADVLLLDDDLQGILQAMEIAKRAMEIVYQNTAIVAVPNIGVVLASIVFALDPILGVIISNGSMIAAELNGFRPLFEPGEMPIPKSSPATTSPPAHPAGEPQPRLSPAFS